MTATGTVTYTDVDTSDTHSFSVSAAAAHGTAGVDASGNWTYTVADSGAVDALAAGETLADSFTVQVADNHGGTATQVVNITITGTNDVPVIGAVSTGSVTEDNGADGIVAGNLTTAGALTITDVDAGQSNFTAHASIAGTYGTFTLAADGAWTYTADNTQAAIQQLGATQSLTDSFTAVSSDGTNSQLRHRHHPRHQ